MQPIGISQKNEFAPYMKQLCSCSTCRSSTDRQRRVNLEALESDISYLCLDRMAIAIFEYLWVLSHLDIDEGIKPSSTGLAMLYYHPEKWLSVDGGRLSRSMFRCESKQRGMDKTLFSLFSGLCHVGQENSTENSAFCGGGICMYLPILQDPTAPPNLQFRIRVLAGGISREGRNYRQLNDISPNEYGKLLSLPPAPSTYGMIYGPNPELRPFIEETLNLNILEITFCGLAPSLRPSTLNLSQLENITTEQISGINSVRVPAIGPCRLVQKLQKRIRLNSCLQKDVVITCNNEDGTPGVIWDGKCCDAEDALQLNAGVEKSNLPDKHEWVLVQRRDTEVEIVRGIYLSSTPLSGLLKELQLTFVRLISHISAIA